MSKRTRFKIGIAWQGSSTFGGDRQRSIPLAQFAPLAAVEGVELISLQKGFGSEQLRALSQPSPSDRGRAGREFPVLDFGNDLDETAGPFRDTAAVMQNLDLVISSDTAVPHLAGALGVPVWVALHGVPDWRWRLQGDDSPWYPSMRLFRQQRSGDWNEVFECMAGELKTLLTQSGS